MSTLFNPCKGREFCKELNDRCITCGRTLEEITATQQLVESVTAFLLERGYSNSDEFLDYLKRKVGKKLKHAAG